MQKALGVIVSSLSLVKQYYCLLPINFLFSMLIMHPTNIPRSASQLKYSHLFYHLGIFCAAFLLEKSLMVNYGATIHHMADALHNKILLS